MHSMNSANVLARLEGKLHGRDHADLGQFQIINLDLVRKGAGDQWEKLKKKIIDVSAHFIEKRIGEGDVLVRCHEGFLVVFDDLDSAAAEERTKAISTELNLFFLGDEILRSLNIRSRTERVDTDQLSRMMTAPVKQVSEDMAGDPEPQNETPENTGKPEQRVVGISFGRERTVVYRAVWDGAHGAVTTQFCVPKVTEKRTRRVFYGRQSLRGRDGPKDHLELDLLVSHAAMTEFRTSFGNGRPLSLCVPLGAPALITQSTRMKLFNALSAIPEDLRRYFHLSVEGIENGTPASTIQEIIRTLHGFSPSVLVHLPLGATRFDRFAGSRVAMFSTGIDGSETLARAHLANAPLNGFLKGAASLNASVGLTGIALYSDVERAMSLGVRFLSGPAIGDELAHPVPPHVFTLTDIRQRSASRHLI